MKTATRIVLTLSLVLAFVFGAVACSEKPGPQDVAATGITLNVTEKTLKVGEEFTLTATVKPDDATDKTVTFSSENTAVVTVTDQGVVKAVAEGTAKIVAKTVNDKKAECTVTVEKKEEPQPEKTLESISVASRPNKVVYNVGETLDLTGGKIKLTYSDKTSETIDMTAEGVSVSGFDSSEVAKSQKITVTYEQKTCEFTVDIMNVEFTLPTKTVYFKGAAQPDLTGGRIVVTNADGSKDDSGDLQECLDVEITQFNASVVGKSVCKFTYLGVEYSFEFTVVDSVHNKDSIKDVNYVEEMKLRVDNAMTYSVEGNGITMTPTANWGKLVLNVTPPQGSYALMVKISAENDGAVFDINFDNGLGNTQSVCQYTSSYKGTDKPLHGINGDYTTGKKGTFEGILLFAPLGMEDAENYEGPFGWKANVQPVIDKLAAGQTVTVSIGITSGNNPVVLEEFYFLTKSEFETEYYQEAGINLHAPAKTEYIVGDTIDLTGGSIDIVNRYGDVLKTLALDDEDVSVEGADFSTEGTKTITVRYGEYSKTFTVNVAAEKAKIELTLPERTSYYRGAVLPDLEGGYLTITPAGGEPVQVPLTDKNVKVKTFDSSTVGKTAVVLSYQGEDVSFEATIVDALIGTDTLKNKDFMSDVGAHATKDALGAYSYDDQGRLVVSCETGDWGGIDVSGYIPKDAVGLSIKAFGDPADYLTIKISNNHSPFIQYISSWNIPSITFGEDGMIYMFVPFTSFTNGTGEGMYDQVMEMLRNGERLTVSLIVGAPHEQNTITFEEFDFLTQAQADELRDTVASWTLTPPSKTQYAIGEQLSLVGGEVITYNCYGEEIDCIELSDESVQVTGFSSETAGEVTVSVTFMETTKTFTVKITESAATVEFTQPTKSSYYKNEKVDLTGGKLTVKRTGEEDEIIPLTQQMLSVPNPTAEVGQKTVKFVYNGAEYDWQITVIDNLWTSANLKDAAYMAGNAYMSSDANPTNYQTTENGLVLSTGGWGVEIRTHAEAKAYKAVKITVNGVVGANFIINLRYIKDGVTITSAFSSEWGGREYGRIPAEGDYTFYILLENSETAFGNNMENVKPVMEAGAEFIISMNYTNPDGKTDNYTVKEIEFLTEEEYQASQS